METSATRHGRVTAPDDSLHMKCTSTVCQVRQAASVTYDSPGRVKTTGIMVPYQREHTLLSNCYFCTLCESTLVELCTVVFGQSVEHVIDGSITAPPHYSDIINYTGDSRFQYSNCYFTVKHLL